MWAALANLGVGSVAFILYLIKRRADRRDAAIILVSNILRAEEVVLKVKELKMLDKAQKTILIENDWLKYRHLFVSRMTNIEIGACNRFFDACVAIDEAKRRMENIFDAGLIAKASIVQEKIFSLENLDTQEGQAEKSKIIQWIDDETHMFWPLDPRDIMVRNIESMGTLTNTPAFSKLERLANGRFKFRKS